MLTNWLNDRSLWDWFGRLGVCSRSALRRVDAVVIAWSGTAARRAGTRARWGLPLGDSLWSPPTSRSPKSNRRDEAPRLRYAWRANARRWQHPAGAYHDQPAL